jgi:hypothetical protein
MHPFVTINNNNIFYKVDDIVQHIKENTMKNEKKYIKFKIKSDLKDF